MLNIGKGYLSYTLAVLAIVGAGAGYVLGFVDGHTALGTVWAGLALIGVRRALPV